ncbi:MarR family transcriptional regulator [Specibacter cremeus]|uniref:MarR family transcriptional regulator n=1 Tax=Specibacter cremeus TaxID=1629051 RepID=UPI000F76EB16|nr:MarR family transcriptional regulator [Specibacter cremeus]
MTITTSPEAALSSARRARARRELGGLDYIRAVRSAVDAGAAQRDIARALGVAQPAISRLLKQAAARGVKPIPEGFSGASPYEIAERYAAGDIDRDTMIRELSAWPYVKSDAHTAAQAEWDSTPYPDPPGTFEEVEDARSAGLIDGEAYDLILDASDDVLDAP